MNSCCPRCVIWIMTALFTFSTALAAEKHTGVSIEPIYRMHLFAVQPKFNPAVTFVFEELTIAGLWDALEVQIFLVKYLVRESAMTGDPFICWHGKIFPFVERTGSTSILSGVVAGDALYYSYSWGSGMDRSLVGRLKMKDGQPAWQDSEARLFAKMFVDKSSDGRIRVVGGSRQTFLGFNRWDDTSTLGWIDLSEKQRLKVIDVNGREISLKQEKL